MNAPRRSTSTSRVRLSSRRWCETSGWDSPMLSTSCETDCCPSRRASSRRRRFSSARALARKDTSPRRPSDRLSAGDSGSLVRLHVGSFIRWNQHINIYLYLVNIWPGPSPCAGARLKAGKNGSCVGGGAKKCHAFRWSHCAALRKHRTGGRLPEPERPSPRQPRRRGLHRGPAGRGRALAGHWPGSPRPGGKRNGSVASERLGRIGLVPVP